MAERIFSVYELNDYARRVLEGDPYLSNVTVAGEISGYKNHYASGHRYFQLKDANANVSCVMFKAYAANLNFTPSDGMKVLIHGSAAIFQRDGRYQIYVDSMRRQGIGDLYQRFEELKRTLEKEGLFDRSRKKTIPHYPKCIGIATSADGAALRDMVRIARRRDPNVEIVLAPCAVQGSAAAQEIVRSIERLNMDGRAEVILCGRGGGSMEDLWCFNEEIVARAIASSNIPVISCVGHETDTTIADFTADLRAATPSMAAELAVPVASELRDALKDLTHRVAFALQQGNVVRRAKLNAVTSGKVFQRPYDVLIDERREAIDHAFTLCSDRIYQILKDKRSSLEKSAAKLNALNPNSVIDRGYACVTRNGHVISDAAQLQNGENISIRFRDGIIAASTTGTVQEK